MIDRLIELKFDPDLLRALWDRSKLPFPQKPAQIALLTCEAVVIGYLP